MNTETYIAIPSSFLMVIIVTCRAQVRDIHRGRVSRKERRGFHMLKVLDLTDFEIDFFFPPPPVALLALSAIL